MYQLLDDLWRNLHPWLRLLRTGSGTGPGTRSDPLRDQVSRLLPPPNTIGRVLKVNRFPLSSASRSWSTPTQLGNKLSST